MANIRKKHGVDFKAKVSAPAGKSRPSTRLRRDRRQRGWLADATPGAGGFGRGGSSARARAAHDGSWTRCRYRCPRRHDPRRWGTGEARFVRHFDDPRTLLFGQSMRGCGPARVRSGVGACWLAAGAPALKGSRIDPRQRAGCFQPGAIGLSLIAIASQGLAIFQAGHAKVDPSRWTGIGVS